MWLCFGDDISAPAVGMMRLTLFNAVTDRQVSLVDVGQYTGAAQLCARTRLLQQLDPASPLIDQLPAGDHTALNLTRELQSGFR